MRSSPSSNGRAAVSDVQSNGYEIIPYRPEHKDGVVKLWQEAFQAPGQARRKYLEWKYERNPYLREPILFAAVDRDGQVVGTRGFHGSRWHSTGESTLILCAEDFAIAPEHRSSGLAAALMRVALEDLEQRGYEYVMNGSGGQATVLQSLAMGWKSVGAMEPVALLARQELTRHGIHRRASFLKRIWRPGRVTRGVYGRLLYGAKRSSFERLDRVKHESSTGPRGQVVVETSPRPAEMAEFCDRRSSDSRIRHVRDPEFFHWRFTNPSREYRFLLYLSDGRLEGYLAIARYPWYESLAAPSFSIVDWEGASHEVCAELLRFALTRGGFGGIFAWTASLSDENSELLERSGFVPTQTELRARGMPCVLIKKLGSAGDWTIGGVPALEPSNWDIRLIDTMSG